MRYVRTFIDMIIVNTQKKTNDFGILYVCIERL